MKTTESKYCKCLYFTANALARKIEKLALESWSKIGLSPSHAYLLLLVLEEPGIQPTGIAEQLQLQPSTITRLLEKMEEKKADDCVNKKQMEKKVKKIRAESNVKIIIKIKTKRKI